MKTINPTNNQLIREYTNHSHSDVLRRIEASLIAGKNWASIDLSFRAKCMHNFAQLLRKNKEQLSRLMTTEMGKPIAQAKAEIDKCAGACDFFADNAASFLKDETIQTEAKKSYITFEPLGVILGIMPWNYPVWQVIRFAVSTLMAGNSVLLKHAENVTGCALEIEKLILDAGFPENVFQVLLIDHTLLKTVIQDDRIRGVALTGSERAGISVGESAGKSLKKTVLELGGSDPYIVLEDADWDLCLSTAVRARLGNCGQSCIAAKRFIIVQNLYDKFCTELKSRLEKLKIGDPLSEDTEVGPMAREDLLLNLDRQVQESIKQGAQLLYGGKRLDRPGFFYMPTILKNVKKGMPVYHEETFGPVFAVISVKDSEEAIAVANDSSYGLGASVWTQNIQEAEKFARQIQSGSVFINSQMVSHFKLPFGGIKNSGFGRELSHLGIKEFVNVKSVSLFG